jgi:hypothetical protein
MVQQYLDRCMRIRCRGNLFTEHLPNDSPGVVGVFSGHYQATQVPSRDRYRATAIHATICCKTEVDRSMKFMKWTNDLRLYNWKHQWGLYTCHSSHNWYYDLKNMHFFLTPEAVKTKYSVMTCPEITAVYSKCHNKPVNTFCRQIPETFVVKAGDKITTIFEGLRSSFVRMTVFAEICSYPIEFLISFIIHACVKL